jgi:hypothetical protein
MQHFRLKKKFCPEPGFYRDRPKDQVVALLFVGSCPGEPVAHPVFIGCSRFLVLQAAKNE